MGKPPKNEYLLPGSFKYASHLAFLIAVTGGFSLWMMSPALYRRHQLPPGGADFFIPLGLLYLVPYTAPSLVGSALGVVGASLLTRRGQSER